MVVEFIGYVMLLYGKIFEKDAVVESLKAFINGFNKMKEVEKKRTQKGKMGGTGAEIQMEL